MFATFHNKSLQLIMTKQAEVPQVRLIISLMTMQKLLLAFV